MLSETLSTELDTPEEAAEREEHFRSILSMLLQSILPAVPPASPGAVRLQEILGDLNQPLSTPRLAEHRTAFESCQTSFQMDLARLKQAVQQGAAGPPPDSATGLPGPAAAQQLMTYRLKESQQTFAAILVLDQLRALNARFGRMVGDDVLKLAAQGLGTALDGSGILHRWRGPAFLVVCTKGQAQADDLEARIRKLIAKRLESTITVESRSIHVKITFTWKLEHVAVSAVAAAREFDDFVTAHGSGTGKAGR